MGQLKRPFAITTMQKVAGFAIIFVTTVVIARLLTPQEIGIFSLSVAVLALAHMLRDFGVGQYLVQEKVLTAGKIRAAGGFALLTSWSLGAIILLSSRTLSGFYGHEGVKDVLDIAALNFFIIPFTAPTISIFRRDMQFGRLAFVNLTARSVRGVLSIYLAYQGAGYMSLAWGSLGASVALLLAASLVRPGHVPWMPSLRGLGPVWHFGWKACGVNLAGIVGDHAPDLILPRTLGFADAAMFSRANGVLNLVTNHFMWIVKMVLIPVFAKENREGAAINKIFLDRLDRFCAIVCPQLLLLAATSKHLIPLLYGDQWYDAIPLSVALCSVMAVMAPFVLLAHMVLYALGQVATLLRVEVIAQCVTLLVFLSSLAIDLLWVACLLVVPLSIRATFYQIELKKLLGVDTPEYFRACASGYLIGMAVGLTAFSIDFLAGRFDLGSLWTVILQAGISGIVWLCCLSWSSHPLAEDLWALVPGPLAKLRRSQGSAN